MPEPSEAYREGYEKGRTDNLGGRLAEITMGMMRDDPGGYFAAGYYDGAGGRKFNVHGSKESAKRSRKLPAPSLPSPLESQWYALCDASEFIPKETVDGCIATLHAAGSQVAAIIGLSAFASHTCPRCGKSGHFRIHFLGRLRHPGACGWEGYMKTGSYISHQIAQVFHTGMRAGSAWKDEADKKEAGNNWGYVVLGFVFVGFYRALAAVVLIPLHCVAVLSQPGQTRRDIAMPLITLVVIVIGIGIGIYELQQAARPQFPVSQQYVPPPRVSAVPLAPVVQVAPSRDPVSYWHLAGNSNDSKGVNNGTDVDIAYISANRRFGQAALFNSVSNSFIYRDNPTGLPSGNQDLTINVWANPRVEQSPGIPAFVSWGTEGNAQMAGLGLGNFGQGLFWLGYANDAQQPYAYPLGSWSMFTATYTASTRTVHFYANGREIGTGVVLAATPNVGSMFLSISKQRPGNPVYFDGEMDELAIFNRVLTASEISNLYTAH